MTMQEALRKRRRVENAIRHTENVLYVVFGAFFAFLMTAFTGAVLPNLPVWAVWALWTAVSSYFVVAAIDRNK